ncbi:MAG TPA: RsmG family class I SAM-dependent methyltransferase [Candidatus Binataceae bacterium]|nr:RsmG family class I SAM-dependent methyltransferase [Candidatus Binataceae bacterium]
MNDSRKQVDSRDIGLRLRSILAQHLSETGSGDVLPGTFRDRIAVFGEMLALWGSKTNLTAHPQDPEEIAFHVVDSIMPLVLARQYLSALPHSVVGEIRKSDAFQVLAEALAPGKRVLDFGSGAGFPGLILAIASEASFTLAEARQKRASFLKVVASQMALENVEIIAARISPATLTATFDTVVSRASGPTPEFYDLAARTLVPGGSAILYCNPSQRLELDAARRAGLGAYRRYRYTVRRADRAVERMLAVWQKPEKSPES